MKSNLLKIWAEADKDRSPMSVIIEKMMVASDMTKEEVETEMDNTTMQDRVDYHREIHRAEKVVKDRAKDTMNDLEKKALKVHKAKIETDREEAVAKHNADEKAKIEKAKADNKKANDKLPK